MRKLARITIGALALAIVLGPLLAAEPAAAAVASVQASPKVPPVNPAGPGASSPRQFMLNVLGSVLGAAMPTAWKREQLADASRYNHDWETLEAQFGTNPANPDYMGSPDTFDDYVIRKKEMDMKGGTKLFGSSTGAKYSVPGIAPSKLQKAAGVAGAGVTVVMGAQMGFAIGNGIDQAIGVDANGLVCSQGAASGLLALATGNDCSAYDNAMTTLQQNADVAAGGVSAGNSCVPGQPTFCVHAVSRSVSPSFLGETCFTFTGTDGSIAVLVYHEQSGFISGSGVATTNTLPPIFGCPTGAGIVLGGSATNPVTWYCLNLDGATCGTSDQRSITDVTADPDRTLHCSVTGTDGITYTADSASFKETDGKLAAPVCPVLPDGVYPATQQISENGGGASNVLSNQTTTPESLSQLGTYPECNTGACSVDLIDHLHGDKSCFDEQATCDGWFSDPTRADDYQCRFGIHDVALSECYYYSGVFNAGRQQIGAPYSDPTTGTWSGGQNAPSEGGQAYDQTIQDPDTSVRDCMGTASTTFDPIAWVMRPVQCALEWAFVPRASVVALEGANVTTAWTGTIFGQIGGIVGQFASLPVFTGCTGVPIDIDETWPATFGIHWTLGAACSGPLAGVAGTVRGIVGALLSLGGALAVTTYIARAIGYTGFGRRGIPND